MFSIQLLICTIVYPIITKARCLTDNSTINHNELVHDSIQDFLALVQNMKSNDNVYENSRNSRRTEGIGENSFCRDTNLLSYIRSIKSMQNTSHENIQKMKTNSSSTRLANSISLMESMQNANSKNIQIILKTISNLITSNENILNAISSVMEVQNVTFTNIQRMNTFLNSFDVLEKIHNATSENIEAVVSPLKEVSAKNGNLTHAVESLIGETDSWQEGISNSLSAMLNHAINMMLNAGRNNTQEFINIVKSLKSTGENISNVLPGEFTLYGGHILLLPSALGNTNTTSWSDSILRCKHNGAVPFIPRSIDDFRYIQSVNSELNDSKGIWLPASDHVAEGEFKGLMGLKLELY